MRKSIGLKIMVPFCILAIVCGLCSTLIYSKIAQMNQATKSISDNYMTITVLNHRHQMQLHSEPAYTEAI